MRDERTEGYTIRDTNIGKKYLKDITKEGKRDGRVLTIREPQKRQILVQVLEVERGLGVGDEGVI